MEFDFLRADWTPPGPPVFSTSKFNWATIEWVVLHYTAAANLPDGDPGETLAQIPAYLRRIHNDYLHRDPGYSIGYNAAVDFGGRTWELRGDTYKCAANADPDDTIESPHDKPGDENARTFAVLLLVDGQDPAPPKMVDGVRRLVAQVRAKVPQANVLGHRDVDRTQCPGNGIYQQINAGVFDVATPTPPPPGGEMVDWDLGVTNPEDAAKITTMPSVGATMANDVDTWAAVGLVKAVQRKAGLTVNGVPNQSTWDAANRFLSGK